MLGLLISDFAASASVVMGSTGSSSQRRFFSLLSSPAAGERDVAGHLVDPSHDQAPRPALGPGPGEGAVPADAGHQLSLDRLDGTRASMFHAVLGGPGVGPSDSSEYTSIR